MVRFISPLSLVLCASAASLAAGQERSAPPWSGPIPPSIAVVPIGRGFARESDIVADLILARLARVATRENLGLVSDRTVRSVSQDWPPASYVDHGHEQELAVLARVAALVDVEVLGVGPVTVARAVAHYASKGTLPDTLPLAMGRSPGEVANRLAQQLVTVIVPRAAGRFTDESGA